MTTLTVGYIPYLNMVPFHHGFGPDPIEKDGVSIVFQSVSPRTLGLEMESGRVDAGALSLVDLLRLSDQVEPLGDFGIGVQKAAGSVLLFSRLPLEELGGTTCAVTDETSTSVRLLQVLLEKRYGQTSITYGRIASALLYDGSSDSLLLIGDEALRARMTGVKGLPIVTDLGEEWYHWQQTPFTFAQWSVRKSVDEKSKQVLYRSIENSLISMKLSPYEQRLQGVSAAARGLSAGQVQAYWDSFSYRLTPQHLRSTVLFKNLLDSLCLTV